MVCQAFSYYIILICAYCWGQPPRVCICWWWMCHTVSASTQQVERVVILLHVIALLVAGVPLQLVAARKPALQSLRAGRLDRHCNVVRGGEFTPVEDIEPLCSFTVTQRVYDVLFCKGLQPSVSLSCMGLLCVKCDFISRLFVSASNLKAVIPERR